MTFDIFGLKVNISQVFSNVDKIQRIGCLGLGAGSASLPRLIPDPVQPLCALCGQAYSYVWVCEAFGQVLVNGWLVAP